MRIDWLEDDVDCAACDGTGIWPHVGECLCCAGTGILEEADDERTDETA